jgi:AraC-like DNA-binding protein
MAGQSPTIIEGLSIERVLFIQWMERKEEGFTWQGRGLPGHQLNVVETGRAQIDLDGQTFGIGRGDVLWVYESEQPRIVVREAPWRFYTIHFMAPSLPPPNSARRCIRLPRIELLKQFETLLAEWRDTSVSHLVRTMRVQGTLLHILSGLVTPAQQDIRFDRETALWWKVESALRKDLRRELDIETLCELGRCSRSTLTRSCLRAVGVSPLRRVRHLRLNMAHGFVILSNLTISEIADRVGYARVHELSRDYHKKFGATPTQHREQYPKIYEREFGLPFVDHSKGAGARSSARSRRNLVTS